MILFEKSVTGRIGHKLPEPDVPAADPAAILGAALLRDTLPGLPEVSEPEVLRHYVGLSVHNHHVDKDFYPLGSCTMKYNPKINDAVAALPGFADLHPGQPAHQIQGALELMVRLEDALIAITGMERFTLQPPAGSSGELAGVLIIRKYHDLKGQNRKTIIIPDSAHGTNPASVIMAGYETVKVSTDGRGRVDLDDLRDKINPEVAGMMLTQPNTLGLFEDHITEITSLVHDAGGLMYMDGANMNALIGLTRSADMGFDITHLNLHKTFSTPHGGGGPGSGPIGVVPELTRFLPGPLAVEKDDGTYAWEQGGPDSIGRTHGYFGNFGMLVRAYAYIQALGADGLYSMTRRAIINANYLKSQLTDAFDLPYGDGSMHEFVLSGDRQKSRGVKTLDMAKKLLDYGVHAPTVYFPLVVSEAMMIEPTESETRATLDRFAHILHEIDALVDSDPDAFHNAPVNTPVRRLDETRANRELDVRWRPKPL